MRQQLPGDIAADVAIVGAGYTGLWTAYYLAPARSDAADRGPRGRVRRLRRQRPQRRLVLGAAADELRDDGRSSTGATRAIAMQRTMHDTVDEVARVTAEEGIDCHFAKGGYLNLARNAAAGRGGCTSSLEYYRSWGFGEEDYRWLTADEASARLKRHQVLGRRLHPALRGDPPGAAGPRAGRDGRARRRHDLRAAPGSSSSATGTVRCETGTVSADVVVRATEGFTARLPGQRRTVAPIYSLMIATEPLPDVVLRRGRLGRAGDVQRRPPADHLRPAHRRRPDRLRRPRRAVPLRLGDQARVRPTRRRPGLPARRCSASCSRPSATPRSPTAGAARSARRATGSAPSASTRPPAWPGPAATSATA